ncbi:ABC transporter substrate-binding protein [Frankia sp. AgB1.9]|uniref:ABC transporter substrate-binding protein n=1 Tax=unclassified Frankia TaxID=2632575 RepID=UPI00193393D7|nr:MULTISPECIES: ABC transporter substrate-binding protein [unclassified Frankia]MBL7488350.1 ABC transporter substrate-binding protein [Frankia sp. AgW1.1]MBL7548495.1 ABC transporter substrate-binding protein [Frankia sp. AgB1.9]MBL7618014.1 ABC transporter substrate-binding protein [Frankia sp. AgB1.8]
MIRKRRTMLGVAATASALLLAAGCGSSSSGGGNASASGKPANKTITIGVLTDVTGPASSGNKTFVDGVKAGVVYAARNGYNIKIEIADTATNPTTALAAAQKLVTQDHVSAVFGQSAIFFTASNYLTAHNVPVIGMSEDGPEWITAKNMFSVAGPLQQTKVAETTGKLFKLLGVTNVAALGYGVSPVSAEGAASGAASAEVAGLKVGYLNGKFPFGSTDVGPEVLAMKSAGIDGLYPTVDPNTGFALITGLRNQGVDLKAALLPTGYGGDLLQAGPGALNQAQGVYFTLGYEPVEMQTAATKQLQADFKSAGITTAPTYAAYNGYVSTGLLVRALKANGGNTAAASIISSLSSIHDWDAMGLFGSHKADINDRVNIVGGADNCTWVTKLEGDKFTLVKGATPICGALVPGKTVAPAS